MACHVNIFIHIRQKSNGNNHGTILPHAATVQFSVISSRCEPDIRQSRTDNSYYFNNVNSRQRRYVASPSKKFSPVWKNPEGRHKAIYSTCIWNTRPKYGQSRHPPADRNPFTEKLRRKYLSGWLFSVILIEDDHRKSYISETEQQSWRREKWPKFSDLRTTSTA